LIKIIDIACRRLRKFMLDSLNITELVTAGELSRKERLKRYRNAVLGFAAMLLLPFLINANITPRPGNLYIWQNDEWRVEMLPDRGIPHTVQVSNSGMVWVNSWLMAGVYVRDHSGKWQTFTCHDFDTECGPVYPYIVHGDELWGVVYDSVIHFDGTHWTTYNDVLPRNANVSIATGKDGVAVLSRDGHLSMFDGETWRTDKARDVLPFIENPGKNSWGAVVTAPDGSFWLAYHGMWRYDGGEWQILSRATQGNAEYYRIMGVSDETIWLSTGYETIAYNPATQAQRVSFSGTETGQAGNVTYNIATYGDESWLSTKQGVRYYNGESWGDMLVQPPETYTEVHSVSVAPDGTLWATVLDPIVFDLEDYEDDSGERSMIISVVHLVGFLFVTTQLIGVLTIGETYRHPTNERYADRLRPYMNVKEAVDPNKPFEGRGKLYTIGALAVLVPIDLIGRAIHAPWWITAVFAMFIFLTLVQTKSIVSLWQRDSTPQQRRNGWQTLNQNLALSLLSSVMTAITSFVVERLLNISLHEGPMWTFAILAVGFYLGYVVYSQLTVLPIRLIFLTKLGKGDYEGAIKQIEQWDQYLGYYVDLKQALGYVALHKGDFELAKTVWEQTARESSHVAGIGNLGYCYLCLKQYEDALTIFSYCVEAEPMEANHYRKLLDYYQVTESYPERALETSEAMMKLAREPRLSHFLHRLDWILQLRARALALANVGRYNEAEAIMHLAEKQMRVRFDPIQSELHIAMGDIKAKRGQLTEANKQYQLALKLDPNGYSGKVAQDKLARILV
jgi:hypothetical protein